jgi:hypothetical protein
MKKEPSEVYTKTAALKDLIILFFLLLWMPIIALGVLIYIIN